ncbi:MAG: capsular biosynthesis protein, partial [Oxalobacteraceae bacterium]
MASPGTAGPTNLTVQPDQRRNLAPVSQESGYGSYGSTASGRELSLSLLWRIAIEWRWLILAAIATSIAAAVLITLLTPLKYRSVASLELNPPEVEIMANEDSKGGRQSSSRSDANFVGTQLALLGSRALAERVAQ